MNEITRIHIAKKPYEIEIDAKKQLEKYLKDIQNYLQDEQLVDEVELRIVELLAEMGVKPHGVIAAGDIDSLKEVLGRASDFADDNEIDADDAPTDVSVPAHKKHLMRDESSGWIGGVLSGLAAHYRWPVWAVRLVAVIVTIVSSGIGALLYLIGWIVIPKANSKSDVLLLQGKATTLQALRELEDQSAEQSTSVHLVEVALRIATAVVMCIIGIVAFLCVLFVSYAFFGVIDVTDNALAVIIYGTGLIAGLALVAFCAASVRLLAQSKKSPRTIRALAVTLVVGCAFGGIALGGFVIGMNGLDVTTGMAYVEKQSVKDFDRSIKGAKQLTVKSSTLHNINYIVTDEKARIEIREDKHFRTLLPYSVVRTGETLTLELGVLDTPCYNGPFPPQGCLVSANVTIYGPALDVVALDRGTAAFHYSAKKQDTLHLKVSEALSARVSGAYIGTLTQEALPYSNVQYHMHGFGSTSQPPLGLQLDVERIDRLAIENATRLLSVEGSKVQFGTIAASTKQCAATQEDERYQRKISYASVENVVVDGVAVTLDDEGGYLIASGDSDRCLELKRAAQ